MIYYPPELVDLIRREYAADETLSQLTIFRRGEKTAEQKRPEAQASLISGKVVAGDISSIKRVLTTTVSIDVPEVPPHGNLGTRVAFPGVGASDQLILSPNAFAGTWGIYHESTDTVVVHYYNSTGTTHDPPLMTFRITALQF